MTSLGMSIKISQFSRNLNDVASAKKKYTPQNIDIFCRLREPLAHNCLSLPSEEIHT